MVAHLSAHTYDLAKRVIRSYARQDMGPEVKRAGYTCRDWGIRHWGIHQRWLVAWSRQAYQREEETLRRARKQEQPQG
jgi:hypothetical protein